MADINSGSSGGPHARGARRVERDAPAPTTAQDAALIGLVELMFFAYRDFTGEADAVLQELEFGRAHHRVLHFVDRRPGLRVADLLDILGITKQSLGRVLKELMDRGYVVQAAGARDRRERRLYVTPTGRALAGRLVGLQTARIGKALAAAQAIGGSGGAATASEVAVREFLLAMIGPEQRGSIAASIAGRQPDAVHREGGEAAGKRADSRPDTRNSKAK